MRLLITYASPNGSTAEIATFMGHLLSAYDVDITVCHADDTQDREDYDAFILGSAVHSGMWLPSLSRFMFRFEEQLKAKSVFLFLVCIIVLEENGLDKAVRDYVWDEALEKLDISRDHIHAFAGRLDWNRITGDEHWIIKGTYEGKMLDEIGSGDYRDWQLISDWTHWLAQQLHLQPKLLDNDTITNTTKDETITEEEVAQLSWPDNPSEAGAI